MQLCLYDSPCSYCPISLFPFIANFFKELAMLTLQFLSSIFSCPLLSGFISSTPPKSPLFKSQMKSAQHPFTSGWSTGSDCHRDCCSFLTLDTSSFDSGTPPLHLALPHWISFSATPHPPLAPPLLPDFLPRSSCCPYTCSVGSHPDSWLQTPSVGQWPPYSLSNLVLSPKYLSLNISLFAWHLNLSL